MRPISHHPRQAAGPNYRDHQSARPAADVVAAPADSRSAWSHGDRRCTTCGYGVSVARPSLRCPMCGGDSWRDDRRLGATGLAMVGELRAQTATAVSARRVGAAAESAARPDGAASGATTEAVEGVTVVRLRGALGGRTAKLTRDLLLAAPAGSKAVIVDLTAAAPLDRATRLAIGRGHLRATLLGVPFACVLPASDTASADTAALRTAVAVHPDLEAALAAIRRPSPATAVGAAR